MIVVTANETFANDQAAPALGRQRRGPRQPPASCPAEAGGLLAGAAKALGGPLPARCPPADLADPKRPGQGLLKREICKQQ
ncbi:MAG TPA: hypothetical protein VFA26_13415 [Gemmataceae bacterium]|nr:hypothetical protein [Gemmataceae bacterium]